jgi:hypothetical protein
MKFKWDHYLVDGEEVVDLRADMRGTSTVLGRIKRRPGGEFEWRTIFGLTAEEVGEPQPDYEEIFSGEEESLNSAKSQLLVSLKMWNAELTAVLIDPAR